MEKNAPPVMELTRDRDPEPARALETWLRGKDLAGPMLGAQRRIEARIGQSVGSC